MGDLIYPLRVVFYGGEDEDGTECDTYEVNGPFRRLGELWLWANRECYLNVSGSWRDDLNALIRKAAPQGWRAIKIALDEWAKQDLEEYDYPGSSRACVLQGDAAWREWQHAEVELDSPAPFPDDWRPVGPVCSCGCEDWPCCVHADDYIYVP